jgi:hypothetical protein
MRISAIFTWRVKAFLFVAVAVISVALVAACGSGDPDVPLLRVSDDGRIYAVDDLENAGMKVSKQYDVADLPGGVDARYGFIRTDRGPFDIEARFYASHDDAVTLGTEFAMEVTGDDADIEEDTTMWPEGYKDRQRMRSGGTADLAAWSGQRGPNYADFVIVGNMILLCQGDVPKESIETCYELIDAIRGGESG